VDGTSNALNPRLLTIKEAASYVGLTVTSYRAAVRRGLFPRPVKGSKRYDLKAINHALDLLSGLERDGPPKQLSPYEAWKCMEIDLKHIHTVKKRLADGEIREYYFHRLTRKPIGAKPGTLEFIDAYKAASIKDVAPVKEVSAYSFGDVLNHYLASADFTGKAVSTQKEERRMLGHVDTKWGKLPVLALNDERVRGDFLEWRDEIATRSPRQADYYIGLLLAHGHSMGMGPAQIWDHHQSCIAAWAAGQRDAD
jgi:hypothetical protein